MRLRPRQNAFVERSVAALVTRDNTLSVAPTGASKHHHTALGGYGRDDWRRTTFKVCILAHRDELTTPKSREVSTRRPWVRYLHRRRHAEVMARSVTFAHGANDSARVNLDEMPALDLLVIDEAHHAIAESYRRIIGRTLQNNPRAKIFGSHRHAEPRRQKGSARYLRQRRRSGVRLGELIASGHLVPPRTFVIDVGVQERTAVGPQNAVDFDMNEVADIMDRATVTDEVIRHWKEKAGDRQTVVFCSTVAHAKT